MGVAVLNPLPPAPCSSALSVPPDIERPDAVILCFRTGRSMSIPSFRVSVCAKGPTRPRCARSLDKRRSPFGGSVAGLCDTLSLNVSSPTKWGRWTAAVAAGRRGLPGKESAKQRCSQHPPQSGSAGQLPQRESTREMRSSIPHRVAQSRNAIPFRGTCPPGAVARTGLAIEPEVSRPAQAAPGEARP
jgi:hypothetical protein